jgi:hypothetical protein
MQMVGQFSLESSNPWKNADKILTAMFQDRAKERAKKNKQRPAPDRQPRSDEKRSKRTYRGAPDADAIKTAANAYLRQRERLRTDGRRILHSTV